MSLFWELLRVRRGEFSPNISSTLDMFVREQIAEKLQMCYLTSMKGKIDDNDQSSGTFSA